MRILLVIICIPTALVLAYLNIMVVVAVAKETLKLVKNK